MVRPMAGAGLTGGLVYKDRSRLKVTLKVTPLQARAIDVEIFDKT